MSRPAMEQVLGKLIMDARFRDAFFRDPWRQPSRPGLSSLRGSATRSGTSGLVRLPRSSGISMANGSATGSTKSVRNTHATVACPWIRRCRTVVEPSTVSRSLERRYQRTSPAIKEMRHTRVNFESSKREHDVLLSGSPSQMTSALAASFLAGDDTRWITGQVIVAAGGKRM